MPLLDALRALTSFAPPATLPDCDPALLGDVLEAHGLAALASYRLESTRLGAAAPQALRERLLVSYQGILNDNVLKLVALRRLLRGVEGVRVVLLDAAAYVDWLYPHMAFRPLGDLRAAVAGTDRARFISAIGDALKPVHAEHAGPPTAFTDGTMTLTLQEGLWPGGPPDARLFEQAAPYRVFGPSAARPSTEDSLLATAADQALLGLFAPLVTYVDVRELLGQPIDAELVKARAAALGLARALHGTSLLVAHYFPECADAAARVRPALGVAERVAVQRIVDAARDPARLRHLRGSVAAARLVVSPRTGSWPSG